MEKGKTRKRIKRDVPSNNWCDLPSLFMSSLLYFLSPKSRCAFKATCRSWNEAKLLLSVPVGAPTSPFHSSPALIRTKLIHADIETSYYECYHPMSMEFFRLNIKNDELKEYGGWRNYLENAEVHCSNFGWLLMSERRGLPKLPGRFFFFFNPFTKRKIDHGRDVSPWDLFPTIYFTSRPTSSDRQVLSRMLLKQYIYAHDVNDGSLTVKRDGGLYSMVCPEVLRNQHFSPHNSLVLHRGSYYCLVGAGVVGVSVFEDDDNDNYTFHDTKLFESGTKLRYSFLLEVDGKLLGIFDDYYHGIMVRWLNIESWQWNPVGNEDLRDTILYVSYNGSFVQCDVTTKGVGNKIYFPVIMNGGVVYYFLDTGKYHTPSCELQEIEDFGDTLTWITPTIYR